MSIEDEIIEQIQKVVDEVYCQIESSGQYVKIAKCKKLTRWCYLVQLTAKYNNTYIVCLNDNRDRMFEVPKHDSSDYTNSYIA